MTPTPTELLQRLTARQLQVVEAIAQHMSNREIAAHLGIACKTVEKHRAAAFERMGIHLATQAVEIVLLHRFNAIRAA